MKPRLTPNMEDYLEVIYLLQMEAGNVRVKDIARKMACTMPSVTNAVKNLEKQGLVYHPKYDLIELTLNGAGKAEDIYRRHHVIKDFLSNVLGLSPEIAEKDACGMEHSMSPETLDSLVRFLEDRS